jgi:hypothetical protein
MKRRRIGQNLLNSFINLCLLLSKCNFQVTLSYNDGRFMKPLRNFPVIRDSEAHNFFTFSEIGSGIRMITVVCIRATSNNFN